MGEERDVIDEGDMMVDKDGKYVNKRDDKRSKKEIAQTRAKRNR